MHCTFCSYSTKHSFLSDFPFVNPQSSWLFVGRLKHMRLCYFKFHLVYRHTYMSWVECALFAAQTFAISRLLFSIHHSTMHLSTLLCCIIDCCRFLYVDLVCFSFYTCYLWRRGSILNVCTKWNQDHSPEGQYGYLLKRTCYGKYDEIGLLNSGNFFLKTKLSKTEHSGPRRARNC